MIGRACKGLKARALCAAAVAATAMAAATAKADISLFTTYDDFAGNSTTGWQGFQANNFTVTSSADTDGALLDGIGDFDNTANATVGTNYGGTPSTGGVGGLSINFPSGFIDYSASEEAPQGHPNLALFNALGTSPGFIAVDFSSPLGGTTNPTGSGDYFQLEVVFNDSVGYQQQGLVNTTDTITSPNANGGYMVSHGTYWTAYLPYQLTGAPAGDAYSYFQPGIVVNTSSDVKGTMMMDNIRIVSVPEPTMLAAAVIPMVGLLRRRRV